jgi:hypothetical protein
LSHVSSFKLKELTKRFVRKICNWIKDIAVLRELEDVDYLVRSELSDKEKFLFMNINFAEHVANEILDLHA